MEPACFYATEKLNELKKELNPTPPEIPPPNSPPKVDVRSVYKDEL